MKDLYYFFLKNLMGAKVRRSFSNTCNGDNSTSTLNQHSRSSSSYQQDPSFLAPSCMEVDHTNTAAMPNVPPRKSVTLEEMIIQLELEEEKARKEKAAKQTRPNKHPDEYEVNVPRRMSCVNNADILRSARNALNQYPRFSLDGRDAMYRSSFHNNNLGRAFDGLKLGRILHLPQSVGGESVIWCKPGVVPKLMGLDAMPVPISRLYNSNKGKHSKEKLCISIRSQNLRRRVERNEMERRQRRQGVDSKKSDRRGGRSGGGGGGGCSSHSCSSTGYCVVNPVSMEPVYGLGGPVSWPTSCNYT